MSVKIDRSLTAYESVLESWPNSTRGLYTSLISTFGSSEQFLHLAILLTRLALYSVLARQM